jgi:anthranilate phosphoribosyltransferase
MDFKTAIRQVVAGEDLDEAAMGAAMGAIMEGQATPAQIAGFLIALRMKGETVTEITAAARVMRELATPVSIAAEHLVDTCGTGGDGANTFNISTASAFVVAAAGGKVAKHGNRSVSSRCGSADVLEAAGVRIDLTAEQVARCVHEIGLGFLFAPGFHSAMRHVAAARRELGVRTVFNLLGPLTNPASAPNQVVGVFAAQWLEPVAAALGKLGGRHALVVHADDGLDEISIAAPTQIAEMRGGEVRCYSVTPEQFGFQRAALTAVRAEDAAQSLGLIRQVLANEPGPARDIVCLNAGAAIYVAGLAASLAEGIERAQQAIASGKAAEKLAALKAYSI